MVGVICDNKNQAAESRKLASFHKLSRKQVLGKLLLKFSKKDLNESACRFH